MATCSDVIARALRLARVVAIGDNPTASEEEEGMTVLQSIYNRLADTALATSIELYEDDDYEAEEGDRVYSLGTVALPVTVIDNSVERRPLDLAAIQYNENDGDGWQTWISDRGDWVRIDDLSDTDAAPLSSRNLEGLCCLVATELAETFGKEIGPSTMAKARRYQAQLQPRNTEENEFF
jgi:hypothetical protein